MNSTFTFRRVGTTGCEILCDGVVIAWTVDETWAAWIVARWNNHPRVAVGAGAGLPDAACGCGGPDNRTKDDLKVKE